MSSELERVDAALEGAHLVVKVAAGRAGDGLQAGDHTGLDRAAVRLGAVSGVSDEDTASDLALELVAGGEAVDGRRRAPSAGVVRTDVLTGAA